MKVMNRLTRIVLIGASMLAVATPAAADVPDPDVFALAGLRLACDGGTVVFTSGELVGTVHEHEGRRGGTQLLFSYRLRDAQLIDEAGQVLRAVGSSSNSSVYRETEDEGSQELGTFVANFTLLGSQGRDGAVHVLLRATEDGIAGIDRGDCRIAW